jgi:enoyl-CoA hydratase/carnithine racemase
LPRLTSTTDALEVRCGEDGVAHLVLNRAPRNLLVPELMDALRQALLDADRDEDVRAVVLDGANGIFCGGLDIPRMRSDGDPLGYANSAVELLRVFPDLGTPVLAAVRGDALALGYSLVCVADVALTVPTARLGTFEASVGMWPMIAQVPALRRLAPRHALENIITGEPFTAQRACEIGVVNRVVPSEGLDDAVDEWVQRMLVAGSALAVGRRSFYRFVEQPYDAALTEAVDEFARLFSSA